MNTERKTTLYDWLNLPSEYPYKARGRDIILILPADKQKHRKLSDLPDFRKNFL